MKALTVFQPWAWALIHGPKRIENRNWPIKYRGPLVIHAGKSHKWDDIGMSVLRDNCIVPPDKFEYGKIIGIVDLVECFHYQGLTDVKRGEAHGFCRPQGTCRQMKDCVYAHGPFCWVLANPRPLPPLAWKGEQGLWTISEEVIMAMESVLK